MACTDIRLCRPFFVRKMLGIGLKITQGVLLYSQNKSLYLYQTEKA